MRADSEGERHSSFCLYPLVQSDFASEETAERFFSLAEVVHLRALDYEQVP